MSTPAGIQFGRSIRRPHHPTIHFLTAQTTDWGLVGDPLGVPFCRFLEARRPGVDPDTIATEYQALAGDDRRVDCAGCAEFVMVHAMGLHYTKLMSAGGGFFGHADPHGHRQVSAARPTPPGKPISERFFLRVVSDPDDPDRFSDTFELTPEQYALGARFAAPLVDPSSPDFDPRTDPHAPDFDRDLTDRAEALFEHLMSQPSLSMSSAELGAAKGVITLNID
jgi:hypothetical protein